LLDFQKLTQLHKPILMGILNITPDSFSDGGLFCHADIINKHITDLSDSGVHIIDIGAESTRPNSIKIDTDTEINRLSVLKLPLKNNLNHFYSIDTYKAKTAEFALKNGFHIVNDVTGLLYDANMASVIADYDAGTVIMYNHTYTQTPSDNIVYDCLVGLQKSLDIALKHNINPHKICLDIGIGFGISPQQNITLINHIHHFKVLGFPLMVGASRKSFINHFLQIDNPQKRLGATIATHYQAVKNGADIIRIHDVHDHKQFFAMMTILNHAVSESFVHA
jgi:dihydropteroate synthase